MIISCPACNTRYLVPDSAIGTTGRQVRCASCRHSWFEEPTLDLITPDEAVVAQPAQAAVETAPLPAAPPPAAPPPAGVPTRSFVDDALSAPARPDPFVHEPPFRPRYNRARMLTWGALAFALVVLGAVVALLTLGSGSLGSRLGFGGPDVPLTIQVTRKPERRTMASGNELLAVTGRIINPTDEPQKVPDIRAELRDAQGRTVYGWTITRPVKQLPPGGTADFDSAAVDVPRGSRALNLSFADSTVD